MEVAKACPMCRVLMDQFTMDELVLDRCATCDGVWFDASELAGYGKRMGLKGLSKAPVPRTTDFVEDLVCPNCQKARLVRQERRGLMLHTCTSCAGWFGAGAQMGQLEAEYMTQSARRGSGAAVNADGLSNRIMEVVSRLFGDD